MLIDFGAESFSVEHTNMCTIYIYVQDLHHICKHTSICLVQAPHLLHIKLLYVTYVYEYIYAQNTRHIYSIHVCICLVQAPRLSRIILSYVKYVYEYVYTQNIHQTYMNLSCASTMPLTYYTLVCQICV